MYKEEEKQSADWRLDLIRTRLSGKRVEIELLGTTLDTLFAMDAGHPMRDPGGAIDRALDAYWRVLREAAHLFSPNEWGVLTNVHSPFRNEMMKYKDPEDAYVQIMADFPGHNWSDDIIGVKTLLPKVVRMTRTEFEAFREILYLIRHMSSDDPLSTMGELLPALVKPGQTPIR